MHSYLYFLILLPPFQEERIMTEIAELKRKVCHFISHRHESFHALDCYTLIKFMIYFDLTRTCISLLGSLNRSFHHSGEQNHPHDIQLCKNFQNS